MGDERKDFTKKKKSGQNNSRNKNRSMNQDLSKVDLLDEVLNESLDENKKDDEQIMNELKEVKAAESIEELVPNGIFVTGTVVTPIEDVETAIVPEPKFEVEEQKVDFDKVVESKENTALSNDKVFIPQGLPMESLIGKPLNPTTSKVFHGTVVSVSKLSYSVQTAEGKGILVHGKHTYKVGDVI